VRACDIFHVTSDRYRVRKARKTIKATTRARNNRPNVDDTRAREILALRFVSCEHDKGTRRYEFRDLRESRRSAPGKVRLSFGDRDGNSMVTRMAFDTVSRFKYPH